MEVPNLSRVQWSERERLILDISRDNRIPLVSEYVNWYCAMMEVRDYVEIDFGCCDCVGHLDDGLCDTDKE